MVVANLIVIMDFVFVNNKVEKCILLQLLVIHGIAKMGQMPGCSSDDFQVFLSPFIFCWKYSVFNCIKSWFKKDR
jgi:hypothetical protein